MTRKDQKDQRRMAEEIKKCRDRLLDTSRRNSLISLRHSERSRQHIRIIDELPDFLYGAFLDGRWLEFKSLPEVSGGDQTPADEETREFRRRLEEAMITDDEYNDALDAVDEESEEAQFRIKKIERVLRNKIRENLGLPAREEKKVLTNSEIARMHGLNPSYEMPKPAPEHDAERHTDKFIQTLLRPEEMDGRLRGLHSYIHSDIEETGVNTLYAMFGFLQWRESEDSDRPCMAPLLLLQLAIRKKPLAAGYVYRVQATGEDPEINLSLSKRLGKDFGIRLPEFTEDDSPESYMNRVSGLLRRAGRIPKKDEWRVRRFITIGRLRFAYVVIDSDLDEDKWPEGEKISGSGIAQDLFLGSGDSSGGDYAEDYNVDTPEIEAGVPLLITSADASQHSALADVMRGKSLAVTGPPGTGKSQTITNIIACALARGKTVLFLAEKMAALEVVHKRLSDAGLDPYCLELHSTKAKRAEVLESIAKRLELRSPGGDAASLSVKTEDFKRHRDDITEYVDLLNSKYGRRNMTIHEYLWATKLRKDRLGDLSVAVDRLKIPFGQADLTESELTKHTDALEEIAALKRKVDRESPEGRHPWFFIENFALNPFEQDGLKQVFGIWKDQIEETQAALDGFIGKFRLNMERPSPSALNDFLSRTESLARMTPDDVDAGLVAMLGTGEGAEDLVSFVESVKAFRSARKNIRSLKDIPSSIDRIGEIRERVDAAVELGAEGVTAEDIQSRFSAMEEELRLWSDNLEILLSIGGSSGSSEIEDLKRIYLRLEAPDRIASIPGEYLRFRTEEIMDEANTDRLKTAADMKKRICDTIDRWNMNRETPERPDVLREYAATMEQSGAFALFNFKSPCRRAKKLFRRVSRKKIKFRRAAAAEAFRDIALAVEEREEIERDEQLKSVCGSSWNGFATDFEKLRQVNEWAAGVREHYGVTDKFSLRLRGWILTASVEDLAPIRELADNREFAALKDKVAETMSVNPSGVTVKKHIDALAGRVKNLKILKSALEEISSAEDATFSDIAEDLPLLQKVSDMKDAAEKNRTIRSLLGEKYAGTDTDIAGIEQTAEFVRDCLAVEEMARGFEVFLDDRFSGTWGGFVEDRRAVKELCEVAAKEAGQIEASFLTLMAAACGVDGWGDVSYADLLSLLTTALTRRESLNQWIRFKFLLAEAERDQKGDLLSMYLEQNLDFDTLVLAFEYMIYSAVTREIYGQHSIISRANGRSLEKARDRVRKLDEEILKLQKDLLYRELNKAKPLPGIGGSPKSRRMKKSRWTEGALIRNEIKKDRRHVAIRDLMKRAGRSVQKIKPCFLMSPLTVAQYLEPGKIKFDIVIIDEASQMRPEVALGAIARARQAVIVGDPKQLPPTSFFQSVDREDEDEDEEMPRAIMDMALSSLRPSRILSRHYRSQHESLIAFANHHFYDGSLVLFPSPVRDPGELGVRLEYVKKGVYAARRNEDEAQAVVKAAVRFMREHPDRSLGIATMNQTQKDLIEREMDQAFIDHPHAERYRKMWRGGLEPFFIKNLEKVQGDERDAIFISTVYGPDKNGVVMQRFGPINSAGGHRRLNVLFTRAKKNMVVFTSLKPEDIILSEGKSQGVEALKGFLSYAAGGALDEGTKTGREPESDFEIWVKERLESIGCEVHPQVGVAGFRIDLGVKHPRYPHGYLLGVECDGAAYHSSKSVRERDIIRQRVLENLGWRIHRIWSTDWFSNTEKAFAVLEDKIEKLLKEKDLPKSRVDDSIDAYESAAEEEEEDAPDDLFDAKAKRGDDGKSGKAALFDKVAYKATKEDGSEEERTVRIVPTQGDPGAGTISQHSAIGRALLGGAKGEEVECNLPAGEVILTIIDVVKSSAA